MARQLTLQTPIATYQIDDIDTLFSPSLLIFKDYLDENNRRMIAIAGNPNRLRPHCKTHKILEVVQAQLAMGITKHKCATLAEAEMLAMAGATDIFLAYNVVGPNIGRVIQFCSKYPKVQFACTGDDFQAITALSQAVSAAGVQVQVLLDIDTGMHRTGVDPNSDRAIELYKHIASSPGLRVGGFHLYDGHNRQKEIGERRQAIQSLWQVAMTLRSKVESIGLNVPRVVAGGTGSFPCFAEISDPILELSPGTVVFHDAGYLDAFPDLQFIPCALLLTRVISKPSNGRVTLDLGHKACAADPPSGRRLRFPGIPDAKEVLQNEEHLVIETSQAEQLQVGDAVLAMPQHVCPTSAVHKEVYVISNGKLAHVWRVLARDRCLTI